MLVRHRPPDLEEELVRARFRIAELERELERRAVRDPLTGLATTEVFNRRLDAEVDRARRHGRPLSVAVLDIDGFRQLNARHGHAVGDAILEAAGALLSRWLRASDVASRTSGDEFTILLPETTTDEALKCLERVLLELEVLTVGRVNGVGASAGVAEYKRPLSGSELAAAAIAGLERARKAGGGRIEVARSGDAFEPVDDDQPQDDAIHGLVEALSARDRYTGEHSESVVDLAARVARGLGLSDGEVWRVRAAALLHDIGKVAIPDEVLHKPGALTDEEWALMREHPVIGERILRAIPGLGGVARIVRHEHERWDGGGYPDGLAGEEIPIGSRIILACDAYHAMTSDRPYRTAMPHSEAVRELATGVGKQFDPQVTEMLIGCLYGDRQIRPDTANA